MKNVLEYDIKTSTTKKGYMHGFQGFANVVKKINLKLKNSKSDHDLDPWAVGEIGRASCRERVS